MGKTHPVRLQLSRRRGFDLQALSRATNGLGYVVVSRPHLFQNRWKIGTWSNHLGRPVESSAEAVALFCAFSGWFDQPHMTAYARERLAGKNLACWCAAGATCHADTLLDLVNPPGPKG